MIICKFCKDSRRCRICFGWGYLGDGVTPCIRCHGVGACDWCISTCRTRRRGRRRPEGD